MRTRLRSRITMYSAATAMLLLSFGLLLISDMAFSGAPRLGYLLTMLLAAGAIGAAGLCLVMGDRLGPLPAVLLVLLNGLSIVIELTLEREPAGSIGVVVQLPVLALYLGAFQTPGLARIAQAGVLIMLVTTTLWAQNDLLGMFSGGRNLVKIALFTWLCLEAGIFVQRRFRRETHVDELTRVLNRRGLSDRAEIERLRFQRSGGTICVAMVDLNDFKEVNDQQGHQAGDQVLRDLSKQWRSLARETDVIARIGGDEFIFLLPDTTLDQARQVMARLNEGTLHAWAYGVVEWDTRELLAIAIARADEEMYRDKEDRQGVADPS